MKIKQLIKKLEKYDPNFEIVLSSDGEGNSFGILRHVSRDAIWDKEEKCFWEEGDGHKPKKAAAAIILFP